MKDGWAFGSNVDIDGYIQFSGGRVYGNGGTSIRFLNTTGTTEMQIQARTLKLRDGTNFTTIADNNSTGDFTITLPSSAGTLGLVGGTVGQIPYTNSATDGRT